MARQYNPGKPKRIQQEQTETEPQININAQETINLAAEAVITGIVGGIITSQVTQKLRDRE